MLQARATTPPDPTQASPASLVSKPMRRTRAIQASETTASPPATVLSEPKAGSRAILHSAPITYPPAILETIRTLGSLLDDLEGVRIANGNRIAALEREHGEALPHLDVVQKQIRAAEHLAELELKREWRKHPLAPWAKQFHGVGEKSIARLIAIIGDPADRPNVAKLWAYCGHGDPARSRKKKGMTQAELFKQGNPAAKKQTWLIACSLLKAGNREHYDAARARYAERVHEQPCVRCGPAGHPAPAGSPWSDAHKHAAALRYTGKEFLKELWVVARATSQPASRIRPPAPEDRGVPPTADAHHPIDSAGQPESETQRTVAR